VKATFEIGKGQGQLYPGGTIRFIVGGCGDGIDGKADADQKGVGGGGGTGVAYKDPDVGAPWRLLLVAAGGGGAHWFFGGGKDGRQGIKYDPADIGDGKAGVYHTEFGSSSKYSGAGAFGDSERIPAVGRSYAGWKGGPNTGEPTGGSGWDSGKSKYFSGGWGFGAGGLGTRHDYMAGGGGGYSGGIKSPSRSGGYGGHSYLNPVLNTPLVFTLERGTTISPKNGYVIYEYGKDSPVSAIHLAKDQTKCIDLTNGNTAIGTNIQLVQCKENPAQQWVIDGTTIRLAENLSKCLDVDQSGSANGANIRLWDCDFTAAQHWL
jgi:hypothetical protein